MRGGWLEFIPVYVTRKSGPRDKNGIVQLRAVTLNAVKGVVLGNVLGWGTYGLAQLAGKVL